MMNQRLVIASEIDKSNLCENVYQNNIVNPYEFLKSCENYSKIVHAKIPDGCYTNFRDALFHFWKLSRTYECILAELAPECKEYNKRLSRKARQVERSLRRANPGNYDDDGRIKKGRHTWVITKSCSRRKRELKSLYRKKAAYTKQSQEELADTLVGKADIFLVEAMDWKALQKRSKQPAVQQEKASTVTGKDGSVKTVCKFKKKKRFGASIRDRAPSQFLTILRRKCARQGGRLITIDTKTVKASQYEHDTGTYRKVPLSTRMKDIGGHAVQGDLYSGFVIKHVMEDNRTVDRKACIRDFEAFLAAQDKCIADMKASGKTYPACFGF